MDTDAVLGMRTHQVSLIEYVMQLRLELHLERIKTHPPRKSKGGVHSPLAEEIPRILQEFQLAHRIKPLAGDSSIHHFQEELIL